MRKISFFSLAALVLLAAACTEEQGSAYDELPVVDNSNVWAFFQALPESDLPEMIKPVDKRAEYKAKFNEMQDGVLGDGEGPETVWSKSDNSIYWSDYFGMEDDYVWSEEDNNKPHPYAYLHVYTNAAGEKLFGVLQSGAYVDGEDVKNPERYYWFEPASGKISSGSLKLDRPYTKDDIAEDPLLLYGNENLYYAISKGNYYPAYSDRGFQVYIDEVGMCGVNYQWNGSKFVRDTTTGSICIYNYGFGNFCIGENLPFDVPGYKTEFAATEGPYSSVYNLVKDGNDEPDLVMVVDSESKIIRIEVCSDRYANIYGVKPGMKVSELLQKLNDLGSDLEYPLYTSIVEEGNFVVIYNGFDEDFSYKIRREDYLGDEKFSPEATVARVCVTNAVG